MRKTPIITFMIGISICFFFGFWASVNATTAESIEGDPMVHGTQISEVISEGNFNEGNILAYGAESASGVDESTEIQAALDGDADIILVPPGNYRIESALVIPAGKTLRGVLSVGSIFSNADGTDTGIEDCTIDVYTTQGSTMEYGSPAIVLKDGASIENITIRYPQQNTAGSSITAVVTGTKTFTISESVTTLSNYIQANDKIVVVDSTGNDGNYTVVSCTDNGATSDIVVSETVSDSTADGKIIWMYKYPWAIGTYPVPGNSSGNPTPTPDTVPNVDIDAKSGGHIGGSVRNVTLYNAYKGIFARGGDIFVENVKGTVMKYGIWMERMGAGTSVFKDCFLTPYRANWTSGGATAGTWPWSVYNGTAYYQTMCDVNIASIDTTVVPCKVTFVNSNHGFIVGDVLQFTNVGGIRNSGGSSGINGVKNYEVKALVGGTAITLQDSLGVDVDLRAAAGYDAYDSTKGYGKCTLQGQAIMDDVSLKNLWSIAFKYGLRLEYGDNTEVIGGAGDVNQYGVYIDGPTGLNMTNVSATGGDYYDITLDSTWGTGDEPAYIVKEGYFLNFNGCRVLHAGGSGFVVELGHNITFNDCHVNDWNKGTASSGNPGIFLDNTSHDYSNGILGISIIGCDFSGPDNTGDNPPYIEMKADNSSDVNYVTIANNTFHGDSNTIGIKQTNTTNIDDQGNLYVGFTAANVGSGVTTSTSVMSTPDKRLQLDSTGNSDFRISGNAATSIGRIIAYYGSSGATSDYIKLSAGSASEQSLVASDQLNLDSESYAIKIRPVSYDSTNEDVWLGRGTANRDVRLLWDGNAGDGYLMLDNSVPGFEMNYLLTLLDDLAVNGGDITCTGDLTITPDDSDLIYSTGRLLDNGISYEEAAGRIFNGSIIVEDQFFCGTEDNSVDQVIHGHRLIIDGYIYFVTAEYDGTTATNYKVWKVNIDDFTDYDSANLAYATYGFPCDIIYSPTKGKLYISFRVNAGTGGDRIVEVNPSDLATSDVVTGMTALSNTAIWVDEDDQQLYVVGYDPADSNNTKLFQYGMSDWILDNSFSDSIDYGHAVITDDTYVYAATAGGSAGGFTIWRLAKADLTKASLNGDSGVHTHSDLRNGSHDIVIKNGYLWLGLHGNGDQGETPSGVVKIDITDLSDDTLISPPDYMTGALLGTVYYGGYIWCTWSEGRPGGLLRINPYTDEIKDFRFPVAAADDDGPFTGTYWYPQGPVVFDKKGRGFSSFMPTYWGEVTDYAAYLLRWRFDDYFRTNDRQDLLIIDDVHPLIAIIDNRVVIDAHSVDISAAADTITAGSSKYGDLEVGQKFELTGTASYDGVYTISNVTNTVITTSEDLDSGDESSVSIEIRAIQDVRAIIQSTDENVYLGAYTSDSWETDANLYLIAGNSLNPRITLDANNDLVRSNEDFHVGDDDAKESLYVHDAGTITFYDDSDDTTVVIGPVEDGTNYLDVTNCDVFRVNGSTGNIGTVVANCDASAGLWSGFTTRHATVNQMILFSDYDTKDTKFWYGGLDADDGDLVWSASTDSPAETMRLTNDGHLSVIRSAQDQYSWVEDFDDEASGVQFESGLVADFWTTAGTNYAAANVTYTAGPGGTLQAVTAGADNDSVTIFGVANYRINSDPVMEARFKVDDISTCFIGVGFAEGSFADKATPDDDIFVVGIDSDNGHGFGAAEIVSLANDNNAGGDYDDMGVTMSNNTYITVKIDLSDTEQPRVWIDGTEIAAGNILSTVQAGISVAPYIMVQELNGGARTLTVDYLKCWQDRG